MLLLCSSIRSEGENQAFSTAFWQAEYSILNHLATPRRSHARPAHAAAAALALVGAGLVQLGWAEVLDPRSLAGRPSAAALLVLASVYLAASAWFYVQAVWPGTSAGQPWWPRRLGLFCDGMLSGTVLAIMTRGHQSGVLGLGLWAVPPVLFAFSGVSAALTFLTWHKRAAPSDPLAAKVLAQAAYVRVVAAILLLCILIAIEIGGRSRAYIPLTTTN